MLKQAQFSALQSQINPHFLYNTLDAIRGEALAVGAQNIAQMTEALSRFFRYSTSQQNQLVSIQEELNNIKNYFVIQKFRFVDRFSLEIDTTQALDLNRYFMPKLTLQPLVENSICHGLEPIPNPGIVTVRVTTTQHHLIILVEDNGIGMEIQSLEELKQKIESNDVASVRQHGGIALCNVNQRIQMLFGKEYGVHIASSPSFGTEVELFLPLLSKQQLDSVQVIS